jgi:hypothetical protein
MSTSDNLQTSSDTVAMQYLLALVILNISIITTSPDIILKILLIKVAPQRIFQQVLERKIL